MKRANKAILLFCILGFILPLWVLQAQDGQNYDIAAFVWPSYHPDDRAKIFWPEGIGEWQTVM